MRGAVSRRGGAAPASQSIACARRRLVQDGLWATYYRLGQAVLTAKRPTIDDARPPEGSCCGGSFRSVWAAYVRADCAAEYQMTVMVGGAKEHVRLWLDGLLLVDESSSLPSGELGARTFLHSGLHQLDLEYTHLSGASRTTLQVGFLTHALGTEGRGGSPRRSVLSMWYVPASSPRAEALVWRCMCSGRAPVVRSRARRCHPRRCILRRRSRPRRLQRLFCRLLCARRCPWQAATAFRSPQPASPLRSRSRHGTCAPHTLTLAADSPDAPTSTRR